MGLGLGLGIQFLSSLGGALSKFLTWGKSSPARFWGTTTPEIWGVTESAGIVVNQFKNRVIADGGIFEAQSCMTAQIQSLFDIQSNIPIGIDVQAQAHYNRVIADGGVVPAGFDGVNSFFRLVKSVYNTTDINTAISAAYDPHYLGYKLGAGSGTTLGQAAQTLYSVKSTENLLFPSEDFASAAWLKTGVTITSNSIIAPDGALTADTFNGAAASFISNNFLALTPQSYTTSIYVKKFITSSISIEFQYHQSGSNNTLVTFNFDTGVISGGTVETLANGWFRIRAITNITANRNQLRIVSADSFYIWGAQLNTGSVALPYTQTTTTAQTLADVTQTTAASQPLLLAHTGENYWFAPYSVTDNCSTPNAAANRITGDIEIIVNFSLNSINFNNFCSKWSGSNIQYHFRTAGGNLQFRFSTDGTTTQTISSTANISPSVNWVKLERNATNGEVKFYTSTNGTTWTQLGATVTGVSGNMFNGTAPLLIGQNAFNGADGLNGKIFRVTIANSIGGTPVVDFNPSSYNPATSQTQWTSATGEVWTINTGTDATGYKSALVTKSIVQGDGIDDVMNSTLSGSGRFTQYLAVSPLGAITNNEAIAGPWNGANWRGAIYTNNSRFATYQGSGADGVYGSTITKARLIQTGVVNSSTGTDWIPFVNGADVSNGGLNIGTENIYTSVNILARSGGVTFSNSILSDYILTRQADNSTNRTAMYDVIRRFNNNAF